MAEMTSHPARCNEVNPPTSAASATAGTHTAHRDGFPPRTGRELLRDIGRIVWSGVWRRLGLPLVDGRRRCP